MLNIGNSKAFIEELLTNNIDLGTLKLQKIKINRENLSILYVFISDKTLNTEQKNVILDYVEKKTPQIFKSVEIDTIKIVADPEIVAKEIYTFIKNNYPSVSMWFEKSDVTVENFDNVIGYTLSLASDAKQYFESSGILNLINAHLYNNFCSNFMGNIKVKPMGKAFEEDAGAVYIDAIEDFELRTFEVDCVECIDESTMPNTATYIADVAEAGNVIIAGTVTSVKERETKKGKPFFIFEVDDTTGRISGVYFTSPRTLDKIREICVGDDIIFRGKMSFYGDKGLSLTIDKINRCKFPENFVMKELPCKDAPKVYRRVSPNPAKVVKVENFLEKSMELPDEVMSSTIVTLDIETTGTNPLSDFITEIGAVKIENGKIIEEWSTLINPKVKLTPEIVKITGITDEMLETAPELNEVFGDFLHFIGDSLLVGHNIVDFDGRFLENAAKKLRYKFNKRYEDTLFLARKLLPFLKRHRLNDVADHFGVEFLHHRALSDARATAEIYLELKNIENKENK